MNIEEDLVRRDILDINYLTIYERDKIIKYEMDYAGNLVPIHYKRVVANKRKRFKRQIDEKIKIGKEIIVDLEICNI